MDSERFQRSLCMLLDVSLGTLWWVREDVWQKAYPRYDQHSDRVAHPATSLLSRREWNAESVVPMLHGTSGEHGPVVVRNLTQKSEEPTSFGHILRPVPLPLREFFRDSQPPPEGEFEVSWNLTKKVSANYDKPKMTSEEEGSLRGWAERRGLL